MVVVAVGAIAFEKKQRCDNVNYDSQVLATTLILYRCECESHLPLFNNNNKILVLETYYFSWLKQIYNNEKIEIVFHSFFNLIQTNKFTHAFVWAQHDECQYTVLKWIPGESLEDAVTNL